MAGGTKEHNILVQNISFLLRSHFRSWKCGVYTETVKLEISAGKKYYYPDVMVSCSANDLLDNIMVKEPVLLVEVVSDSTLRRNLGSKLDAYLTIPGLQAYLILDQAEYWVRLYEREENTWKTRPLFTQSEDVISIPSLQLQIPLSAIYEDILFT